MDKVEYGSELYVAVDGAYAGRVVISDTIKDDAVDAIQAISRMGITTAMLTGDSQQAADYIASKTGIDDVRAKLLPQDKVNQMDVLRQQYGPVLFVGDGINDAPVLAGADVGAPWEAGPMRLSKRPMSSSCSPVSAPYRQRSTCPGKP